MPEFSPQQDAALGAVSAWLKAKPGTRFTPQIFRLFGYAGTGKTTLARHLAEHVDGKVSFAAFTGKAALVMRAKGCDGASTIHSLIYKARESGEETPSFELWDEAPASKAALIVIDECSMVDAELGRDLLSFGVPVLVLGDPAQLPPIQGARLFHRKRARRHADRSAPAGAGRSDRAAVDAGARRQAPRTRPLWRYRDRAARRIRSRPRAGSRSDPGRPQRHAARLQYAAARTARPRGRPARRRRQARLPAQQPPQGPVQWRAVDREGAQPPAAPRS